MITQKDLDKVMFKNRYATLYYKRDPTDMRETTVRLTLNKVRKEYGIHIARELVKRGRITVSKYQRLELLP